MVEALQRVLREIFHPQQADGLWMGGAVHQGDALEDLQQDSVSQEKSVGSSSCRESLNNTEKKLRKKKPFLLRMQYIREIDPHL